MEIDLSKSGAGGWTVGSLFRYRIWTYIFKPLFRFMKGHKLGMLRLKILRIFGSSIGENVWIDCGARIDFPWNLTVDNNSWIGEEVWIYNQAKITIGSNSIVSHKVILCTGTHEISDPYFTLVVKPIEIGNGVWVGMRAFISPGIKLGDGCVVGACSVVTKNVDNLSVVAGVPSRFVKRRVLL